MYLNNGKAAMLVYPTNPPGIELYYHANVFFCLGGKQVYYIKEKEESYLIKQWPETPKRGQFKNLLFSLTIQPVRINNPEAPLLGLAKSIYYQ